MLEVNIQDKLISKRIQHSNMATGSKIGKISYNLALPADKRRAVSASNGTKPCPSFGIQYILSWLLGGNRKPNGDVSLYLSYKEHPNDCLHTFVSQSCLQFLQHQRYVLCSNTFTFSYT